MRNIFGRKADMIQYLIVVREDCGLQPSFRISVYDIPYSVFTSKVINRIFDSFSLPWVESKGGNEKNDVII